jgi:predicted amidohydrolase
MQDLKVTIIQTALFWEDADANLTMFDKKIDNIADETDLIVLPEMFTTGFSMNAQNLAQDMNGRTVDWVKKKAADKRCDMTGSVIIWENGKYYNRLLWAKPDGSLFCYDKRHLFRMTGEEKIYSAGDKNITVDLNGWRIRPFICYDLRFPCWTRNFNNSYDVAIFVANWPQKRSYHWKTLLLARAMENQCYVIGLNRVGEDGNGYYHSGDSSVIDPAGNIIFQRQDEEIIFNASISHSLLTDYRKAFPAWMDADKDFMR